MDIKETLEVLEAAHQPVKSAIKILEDGVVSPDEFGPELKEILADGQAAIDRIDQVPAELKDISWAEGVQVTMKIGAIAKDAYQLIRMLRP